jgi:hypothetical protein
VGFTYCASPPPYINNNIDTIRKPLESVAFSVFGENVSAKIELGDIQIDTHLE